MSLLFYIDEKNNAVLRPDCIKLCPELSVLDEQELLLIILAYDYHSPYRQWPEPERKRKAMIHVYGEKIDDAYDTLKMKAAIAAYMSLQYDSKVELAHNYQHKIDNMLRVLEEDSAPTSIKKSLETIDLLRKSIRELQNEYEETVKNKGVIKGNQELSLLEELQRNVKLYKSIIAKR